MLKKMIPALCVLLATGSAAAQNENAKSDTVEVTVKVIKKETGDSVLIDHSGRKWVRVKAEPANVTTSWWGMDIGFSNFSDNTDYASAEAQAYAPGSNAGYFDLRNGKSMNVNIWFFNQRVNLIRHVVNLKYAVGLELNNYRYKSNIRYNEEPSLTQVVMMDATPGRSYKKNKLAADYLTVPLMLNFNFLPENKRTVSASKSGVSVSSSYGYGFSAGVSAGYLYTSRNKFITSDEGKRKIKDDFGLRPWKISYVGEVNLGYVSIYGSYATKSMYKHGLDMTPYNVGLRFGF